MQQTPTTHPMMIPTVAPPPAEEVSALEAVKEQLLVHSELTAAYQRFQSAAHLLVEAVGATWSAVSVTFSVTQQAARVLAAAAVSLTSEAMTEFKALRARSLEVLVKLVAWRAVTSALVSLAQSFACAAVAKVVA